MLRKMYSSSMVPIYYINFEVGHVPDHYSWAAIRWTASFGNRIVFIGPPIKPRDVAACVEYVDEVEL